MPEGPEIQRAADSLNALVEGKIIKRVEFYLPKLKHLNSTLSGKKIRKVYARSKALIVDFGQRGSLYTHNQLYGKWWTSHSSYADPEHRQLRVLLETKEGVAKLYSASDIHWFEAGQVSDHPYIKKLGPEALRDNQKVVTQHIKQKKFANRPLHTLLLDQAFVSGLGNYLRSEILFEAALMPDRKISGMTEQEINSLANQIIKVTKKAYKHAGVTVTMKRYEQLVKEGYLEEAARHFVYMRDEDECYRCGSTIKKDYMSSRRLYFCENCQH